MPQTATLLHDFEIRYRGRDGRQRPMLGTVTGESAEDAICRGLDVVRGMGVGGPAGLRLLDLQVEDRPWTPRVPLAYSIGPGPQLTREGLPLISNADDWRHRATLTVGHPDAYVGPRPDAWWRAQLLVRPVLPAGTGDLVPTLRARLRDGSVVDANDWAARNGLTREQAMKILTDCGLAVVEP